jgi:hypothetical protein
VERRSTLSVLRLVYTTTLGLKSTRLHEDLYPLCRGLHILPIARIKASKKFKPNHAMLAKHHSTLLRCDCIWTLRSPYKGMQKNNDPHSYGSRRIITLPSGQHFSKGCYPKRTGLYPCNPDPPQLLSEKGR